MHKFCGGGIGKEEMECNVDVVLDQVGVVASRIRLSGRSLKYTGSHAGFHTKAAHRPTLMSKRSDYDGPTVKRNSASEVL